MSAGYMGKILLVDLTSGSISEQQLGEAVYRGFIGGLGLGVRLLYEHMRPGVDPLGADNVLGFFPGLLTGTKVLMTGRHMVATKSPLTGTWCDSNAGGFFGMEMKRAGYDGILISGVSPHPVYLLVREGTVKLNEATHLWGRDTNETVELLKQELDDPRLRVACIGPSGESLSLLAAIVHDKTRVAGRGGVGAVMGAKRLKAIVVRGNEKVPVADGERITRLKDGFIRDLWKSPFHDMLKKQGTAGGLSTNVIAGAAAIRNWTLIGEEGMPSHSKISGDEVTKYQIRKDGCYGCPVACGGIAHVEGGPYATVGGKRPEYETLAAFGTMCLNDNVESIIKASDICNRYGMDTMSAGTAIAFAMECYEQGIIGKKETEGIELNWGNSKGVLALLGKMVRREGLGDVLADGVKRASERIGKDTQEFAIHVHGQEPGFHDPRLFPGRGTLYISDPNPGRHGVGISPAVLDRGGVLGTESVFRVPNVEKYHDYDAKGPLYALGADFFQLISSAGLCAFGALIPTRSVAECISAVTGWDFSIEEGLTAGRRIQTLRQCFNCREGLRPIDFTLPKRLSVAPSMGPYAGVAVDFAATKASYFAAMGWDLKTGKPYQRTLNELGLQELTGDLWN
jgi:aldehyde:ferredoxin oxidoreductase